MLWSPWASTREAGTPQLESLHATTTEPACSGAHTPQLEKPMRHNKEGVHGNEAKSQRSQKLKKKDLIHYNSIEFFLCVSVTSFSDSKKHDSRYHNIYIFTYLSYM